jgi:hypothetical protein
LTKRRWVIAVTLSWRARVGELGAKFDIRTWRGIDGVVAFSGFTAVDAVDVCFPDVGKSVEVVESLSLSVPHRRGADGNLSAVHVHLAVAEVVLPCPCQESVAGGCVGWNGEVVLGDQRAASDHGFDYSESCTVVVGEGELAGASVVCCAAGECDVVGFTCCVGCHWDERPVVLVALARVVGAIGQQR